MKILVVCQRYYPENFQITPICEQLVQDGFDVTVLTGLPNYPQGTVPAEYKKGHRDEYIHGVHVIRCYEIGRRKGVLWLGLNYVSFWLSSMIRVGRLPGDFDRVFVYQLSPVLMGLPGRKYARRRHVPMVLYCCDIWPESMKVYVKSERDPAFLMGKALSRMVYRAAQRIAVQSNSFIPYLRRVHDLPEDRLIYLPAFADESYLSQDFRAEDETVDFVFLGNLGMAQDLLTVLSAVERIRDVPGFRVHFVGDGSSRTSMEQFVRARKLEDVVCFYGWRQPSEMPSFYRLADACMVSLKPDNLTGLTLPSKVQGYMAAGKPIIGMIDGSAREVIEQSGCGVCVGAGDAAALAEAMRDFICHPGKYKDCGERGRAYFRENFSKSVFMDRLEKMIKEPDADLRRPDTNDINARSREEV